MARDHNFSRGDFYQGVRDLKMLRDKLKEFPEICLYTVIKKMAKEVGEKAKELAPDEPEPRDKRPTFKKIKDSLRVYFHQRKKQYVIRFYTRHAAAQHERMDYDHPTGQAKYLEQPYREAKNEFLERIGAGVELELQILARRKARKERARLRSEAKSRQKAGG